MPKKKKSRGNRGGNRQRNTKQEWMSNSDEDKGGYLTIGGLRVLVTPQGTVSQLKNMRTRRHNITNARQYISNEDSDENDHDERIAKEMDSDDMLDYIKNMQNAPGGSDQGEDDDDDNTATRINHGTSLHHYEMLQLFRGVEIGDEGAPEDIGVWNDDTCDDDEDDDDDDNDASSEYSDDLNGDDDDVYSLSDQTDTLSYDEDLLSHSGASESDDDDEDDEGLEGDSDNRGSDTTHVLTSEELQALPIQQQFPVLVRNNSSFLVKENPKASKGKDGKRKQKSVVKGAKGGKLLPGEKARLRRENIERKRVQRAIDDGFDLVQVNKELERFVGSRHDVHVFPKMSFRACRDVIKLARLYGCKAGAQGSGKKRRSVIVYMTDTTEIPSGGALKEVERLMAAHLLVATGGGASDYNKKKKGKIKGQRYYNDFNDSSSCGDEDGVGYHSYSTSKKKKERRKHDKKSQGPSSQKSKPVSFVSRGLLNPDDDRNDDNDAILLPVFEDRSKSGRNMPGDVEERPEEPPFPSSHSHTTVRGQAAAEGITNPGRLIGLGMALGIGAEVFGASPVSTEENGQGDLDADLSPLRPRPPNSAQKKKKKNVSESLDESVPLAVVDRRRGGYAEFEAHTTGIGSKLLAKWGFQGAGSGLGKEGTGISEPLQVKMRAKRMGLGAEY